MTLNILEWELVTQKRKYKQVFRADTFGEIIGTVMLRERHVLWSVKPSLQSPSSIKLLSSCEKW